MSTTSLRRRPVIGGALTALVAAALVLIPTTASAQPAANPFQRGPNPTAQSIEATTGPFAVTTVAVSASATPGFGSANITYPTATDQGTFGIVAIAPGFTASESTVAWLRPRIASQGFVVISINTEGRYDQPTQRGQQLNAALNYVVNSASAAVRQRIDPSRRAVMGHSMGGGGALYAAATGTNIEAAIPLAGYNSDKTWPEVRAAVLVLGMQNDSVASNSSHSTRFYSSLTNAEEREYLEISGASHTTPVRPNTPIARNSIAWLKRFVDNDTRYTQFICPPPAATGAYSAVQSSCPIG